LQFSSSDGVIDNKDKEVFMNNTVELEEEYDANDENPYGKYSISAPRVLI